MADPYKLHVRSGLDTKRTSTGHQRQKAIETQEKDTNSPNSLPTFGASYTTSGKGGGALRSLEEKLEVNGANGTLSLGIPIPATPTRSGFGPQLLLSYDSGNGNGPFGFGWNLAAPCVSRGTARNIPTYDDDQDVFTFSGSDDLVPLFSGIELQEKTIGMHRVRQYQPRNISEAVRIERWSNIADSSDVHWRTISEENITSIYGQSDESRVLDRSANPVRIFSWLLCNVYDASGNAMLWSYKPEDDAGVLGDETLWEQNRQSHVRRRQRYLKSIKYGNKEPARHQDNWEVVSTPTEWLFEVVFDYGEHAGAYPTTEEVQPWTVRSDPFSNCSRGFEVRSYRLCRRILMFHHFREELGREDSLVSSVELTYNNHERGTFLEAFTACGHFDRRGTVETECETENMPPLHFGYSQVPLPEDLDVVHAQTANILSLPTGASTFSEWTDLDGDGIPGILTRLRDGTVSFQRNLSALTGQSDLEFGPPQVLRQQPSFSDKQNSSLQDLSGNGRLDLVCLDDSGRLHGYYERLGSEGWADYLTFLSIPSFGLMSDDFIQIDLTGDGLLDALHARVTERVVWQPCLGKGGFGEHRILQPSGTEIPRLQGDSNTTIYTVDMTGDGLSDVVSVSNGRISYWSNLGYGSFGSEVSMLNAPIFEDASSYNTSRIRFVDVDGSGTSDLLYLLPQGGASLYYNLSGNAWSSPVFISGLPPIDQLSSVFALDLLGNGTACLCWVSPSQTTNDGTALHYLDLMGSVKPHLLTTFTNGFGNTTKVCYSPSTRFFLEDEAALRPWKTRLPFPVQCVSNVTVTDTITGVSNISQYRYHDGFFDGEEREFRGFGVVEQLIEDRFPMKGGQFFTDSSSMTKTWYSTGSDLSSSQATFSDGEISHRMPEQMRLGDSRDALRALRGKALRSEIYDGAKWTSSGIPYSVVETTYHVIDVQRRTDVTKYGVFRTLPSEVLTMAYEQEEKDPRISHEITLSTNKYGDVTQSAKIFYPRPHSNSETVSALLHNAQSGMVIETTEVDYTNAIDDDFNFRKPLPCCTKSQCITGAVASSIMTLKGLQSMLQRMSSMDIHRERMSESRTFFRSSDLTERLSLGKLEVFSLPERTFTLAFTPDIVQEIQLHSLSEGQNLAAQDVIKQAGYVDLDSDGQFWMPSPKHSFPIVEGSTEISVARHSFCIPTITTDALGNQSLLEMDKYHLMTVGMTDAIGNRVETSNDYERMQPSRVTDQNMNRQEFILNGFGNVVGVAVMGKGEDENQGESLTSFRRVLSSKVISSFFDEPTQSVAKELLGSATERTIFHFNRHHQSLASSSSDLVAAAIATIKRYGPGAADEYDVRITVTHLDGSARPYQSFDYTGNGDRTRQWRCNECILTSTQGEAVKSHDAFFSTDCQPRSSLSITSPVTITHHDALSRSVVTLRPDKTWSKTKYSAWSLAQHDSGDTILAMTPAEDPDVRAYTSWLLKENLWQSWYQYHQQGGDSFRLAAQQSEVYYNTPVISHLVPRGDIILEVEANDILKRTIGYERDPLGNIIVEYDSTGRAIVRHRFNLIGHCVYSSEMDGSERWQITNCLGLLFMTFDNRRIRQRHVYDEIQRPTELWMSSDTVTVDQQQSEKLIVQWTYGEVCPESLHLNLRGKPWKIRDQSGVSVSERYDIRGNCTSATVQLCKEYKSTISWSDIDNILLENNQIYRHTREFDYVNRIRQSRDANGVRTQTSYDPLGNVSSVYVSMPSATAAGPLSTDKAKTVKPIWKPYIIGATYAADDKPLRIDYGNSTVATFTYNELNGQLINQKFTQRNKNSTGAEKVLSDISHTYDCLGRKVQTTNLANKDVFFRNSRVQASSTYIYDALGQLVSATGREKLNSEDNHLRPHNASSPGGIPSNLQVDDSQLIEYIEIFSYDVAGNITSVKHQPQSDHSKIEGWTRRYYYEETSLLEPEQRNNRLSRTTVSGVEEKYGYDDDAGKTGCITSMPGFSRLAWGFHGKLSSTSTQVVTDGNGIPETTYYVYNHAGDRVRKVVERASSAVDNGDDGSTDSTRIKDATIYLPDADMYSRFAGNGSHTSTRYTSHVTSMSMLPSTQRIALLESEDNFINDILIRYQGPPDSGQELDDEGRVISYEEYSPWGVCTYAACSSKVINAPRRYRFARYLRDRETGLDLCGARYYMSWLGRWLSPDPIGTSGGVNLFCYATNDPVNLEDPGGTMPNDLEHEPAPGFQVRYDSQVQGMARGDDENPDIEEMSEVGDAEAEDQDGTIEQGENHDSSIQSSQGEDDLDEDMGYLLEEFLQTNSILDLDEEVFWQTSQNGKSRYDRKLNEQAREVVQNLKMLSYIVSRKNRPLGDRLEEYIDAAPKEVEKAIRILEKVKAKMPRDSVLDKVFGIRLRKPGQDIMDMKVMQLRENVATAKEWASIMEKRWV